VQQPSAERGRSKRDSLMAFQNRSAKINPFAMTIKRLWKFGIAKNA
jgi:hypothetical protein